jgi:hypothetical protein
MRSNEESALRWRLIQAKVFSKRYGFVDMFSFALTIGSEDPLSVENVMHEKIGISFILIMHVWFSFPF